jgi:lipopolysaccharide/colanic/teichoic acid biosynthesis glycosyltransferase
MAGQPANGVAAAARRTVDVAVAFLALIVLLPVVAAIALAIRATSPGPAFFRQQRVGRDGRLFTLYKFRTMRTGADDSAHRAYVQRLLTEDAPPAGGSHGLYKLQDDPRVTSVGAFLRRSSLDELPQLLNVVRGDMALVGPRPVLPWEAALFDPRYRARFSVRPGLTGLWQVSGRARLTMREALDLDVAYVEQQRLSLDLRILAKTVPIVLFRHATW